MKNKRKANTHTVRHSYSSELAIELHYIMYLMIKFV